eukprot:scaffold24106_cov66-Skeletonema_marinoi.AAC.1
MSTEYYEHLMGWLVETDQVDGKAVCRVLEVSAKSLKKEDGKIVNGMAHSYYSQILSEPENLSAPV